MSAVVLKFQRPAKRRVERVDTRTGAAQVTGFSVELSSRPGTVFVSLDGGQLKLELSLEEARSLAADLIESADDADDGRAG